MLTSRSSKNCLSLIQALIWSLAFVSAQELPADARVDRANVPDKMAGPALTGFVVASRAGGDLPRRMWITLYSNGMFVGRLLLTSENPRFQFPQLPGGRIRLEVDADGYERASLEFDRDSLLGGCVVLEAGPRRADTAGSLSGVLAKVSVSELKIPSKALVEMDKASRDMQREKWNSAIEHLTNAIALYPDFVEARNNLGVAFLKTGRTAEAEEEFWRALKLSPYSPALRVNLGLLGLRQGLIEAAIDHFYKAVIFDPSSAQFRLLLGDAFAAAKEYALAEEAFRQALQLDPGSVPALRKLGKLYARTKRYDQAISMLSRLLAHTEGREALEINSLIVKLRQELK